MMVKEYQPFSIREQFTNKPEIQLQEMDQVLSTEIFNFVWKNFLSLTPSFVHASTGQGELYGDDPTSNSNFRMIWTDFFHFPASDFTSSVISDDLYKHYSKLDWYEKYNFLEFAIRSLITQYSEQALYQEANKNVLESNNSGFRFIKGLLAPITGKTSIKNLTKGADSKIDAGHLSKALTELNKRKNRNTSQVAVEAMTGVESALKAYLAQKLPDDRRAAKSTVGVMLSIITKNSLLTDHSAYAESMSTLYGYLSDVARHGQKADDKRSREMSLAEATYILEICSAFVNYLNAEMQDGAPD